jgi:hypothetical protein
VDRQKSKLSSSPAKRKVPQRGRLRNFIANSRWYTRTPV